jgi:hypothetical protein
MKIKILSFIFCLAALSGRSQISLTNGRHNLEISGTISTFYNQRIFTPGNPENRIDDDTSRPFDKSKNRFGLRDAQLQLEGRIGHEWEYELQVDFADMINPSDIGENPGLMDAWVQYKGLRFLDIKAGYQKIPYSRNSLVPFIYSPFWQRSEITRGEFFSRRDIGITLEKSLWNQKINLYAGMYSGMGEQVLTQYGGDNDPSGQFEYVVRADVAWPSRYRYRDYDVNQSPLPMFAFGLAGRSVKRTFSSFLPGDDYYLRVISGTRQMATVDFTFQYKGFSLQGEYHLARIIPTNDIDPDADNNRYREQRGTRDYKIGSLPTDYFMASGFLGTISYSNKKLKSIFSLRYDNFNPNDLVKNNTEETLSFAYAYQINGFNAMVKAQYWYRLSDRTNPLIQRFDDQFRIGIQFLLR